ncbi:MAG TPA: SCO family protein [Usitatibacter sp.]|nr:SCO family protein [Usitatibacter sp.]
MRRAWALMAAVACCAALARAAPLDPEVAIASSRAAIGSMPGDFTFTDTSGRRVTLAGFRGRPLVVSFVYTGCSQVCPTTTRFLSKAVREARQVVGPEAFDVVSIGFNVPADNPVSMKVFARQNGIDDPRWAFVVPDAAATPAIAQAFGFSFAASAGGFDHLTQVTILDASGRIRAQLQGESFALPMLVQPLRELSLGQPLTGVASAAALVDRVRLLCTVYDPLSGKYRLDYALFIEMLAGVIVLGGTAAFLVRERLRARGAS